MEQRALSGASNEDSAGYSACLSSSVSFCVCRVPVRCFFSADGAVEDTGIASCSVLERVTAEVLGVEELGVKEV